MSASLALLAVATLSRKTFNEPLLIEMVQSSPQCTDVRIFKDSMLIELVTIKPDYQVKYNASYFVARRVWFPWLYRFRIGKVVVVPVAHHKVKSLGNLIHHARMLVEVDRKTQ